MNTIAELCKGSTADSDSVCLGSNPSSAARKNTNFNKLVFFERCLLLRANDVADTSMFSDSPIYAIKIFKGSAPMKIKDKILLDRKGLAEHGPINIVIFGDSVSHGAVNGYIDYENVYWNRLKKMLNQFRDYIPVNMINASIGGTTAKGSVERFERQVLKHEPDLVIICFGLNDVNGSLEDYLTSLERIFELCIDAGIDAIFMTPNMLNTSVADDTPKQYYDYAIKTAEMQNSGRMDKYINLAVTLAERHGIPVCDCYKQWKQLSKTQNITLLLANRINHPIPEMHQLFADSLYNIIMGSRQNTATEQTTMFQQ